MKSIKKQFKTILSEIELNAHQLDLLSDDLTILSELHQLAQQILAAVQVLSDQSVELKKTDFISTIQYSPAFIKLEELIDHDVISQVELVFFASQDNDVSTTLGQFLKELLDKLDAHFAKLIKNINQLCALLDTE